MLPLSLLAIRYPVYNNKIDDSKTYLSEKIIDRLNYSSTYFAMGFFIGLFSSKAAFAVDQIPV